MYLVNIVLFFYILCMGRTPNITEAERSQYLTNKQLLAEWYLSIEADAPTTRFSLALKLIAERSARRYANNRYYEDNVGNALLRMLEKWKNFDPEKSTNAFAYFTQVAKMEFFRSYHTYKQYVYIDLLIVTGEYQERNG